jgi:ubiquinol-cytochrome c reductase cytochrome c1 subunit
MKLKTFVSEIAKASVLGAGLLVAGIGAANAAEGGATPHYPLEHPKHVDWSFAGPFGTWDKAQLQRGFKVYREVCSACHSLDLVSFRTLEDLGFSEEQVKAIASEYEITDGPNDDGEMYTRPGRASDYFPAPFPNDKAAAYANNGAVPPDFSLIAKARAPERGFPTFLFDVFTLYAENGPDYLYSLLTGYGEEPPESVQVADGTYYNPYFSGGPALAMAQPIYEGSVTYDDGSPETVDQYAKDVSAFLMWAAEPMLVERKQMGFNVMIFLLIFASLLYFTKKKVWSGLKD